MKKRPLIIIMVLILIALTIAIAYFGYNIYEYNNQKAKVENYIISGELDKAKETLKKAMKFNKFSGLDDNRTLSAIENFKISIDKFEQKDYEEADKYMKKIDETKLKDKKLMADIISFKSKLKDKLATESQYNATITEIESLIEKNEYKEANNKFSALSNLKLDDEQNKYVSKLKIKVTEEINRLKKEEEEQKEREKKEREEAILAENKKKEEEARKVLEEE
ncbi:MAG: hypothetical protein Q4P31_04895 [Andreesenia angusta]|nr:hypothetical protein [Andreesenia angusta]